MKMFGTVFFALCMFFLAFVFLAGTPIQRIDRGCLPVKWVGRAVTTVAAIASETAEDRARLGSSETVQACRFFMFRQFYSEELERQRELYEKATGQGAAVTEAADGAPAVAL